MIPGVCCAVLHLEEDIVEVDKIQRRARKIARRLLIGWYLMEFESQFNTDKKGILLLGGWQWSSGIFLPQKVSGRWCLQVQREIKLSNSRSTSKGQRKPSPNIPNSSILCPGGELEKETTESGQAHLLSLNSVTYLLPLSEMQYWARWTAGLIQYVS